MPISLRMRDIESKLVLFAFFPRFKQFHFHLTLFATDSCLSCFIKYTSFCFIDDAKQTNLLNIHITILIIRFKISVSVRCSLSVIL
jgi:hypothetical protein